VITGIGCVSPNGIGRTAFADALLDGRSGLSFLDHATRKNLKSRVVGAVRDFEPTDHVTSADARRTPRMVPLAVAAAREALEQAGGTLDPQRVAVSLGTGGGGIVFVEQQYEAYFLGGKTSPFAITAGTPGNLASELSIVLGLRGPSHVVSTGCASGIDAVAHAADLIRLGRCDAAVTGGSDAPISRGTLAGFEAMKVIGTSDVAEPADACRPFAADRDGFILAEGSWMFVLEAADIAEKRGAKSLATFAGYGSTCDAFHRTQIAPDVAECVRATELAFAEADVSPEEIDYVNLHGTGTVLNDRLETLAMHKVFGDRARHVPMSATKSLIGHPQGAGGTAGLAATILCAGRGTVHGTRLAGELDADCDLDYVIDGPRDVPVRTALLNCLAFGSKNSAVVLTGLGS
jgi:3-oxoacyl-[acyl-carrier-protein] synthase II